MRKLVLFTLALTAATGTVAAADGWTPGEEIVGQTATVNTNGVVSRVYLASDGTANITSASGQTTVAGTWTASAGKLCLNASGASECWPYQAPFEAGKTVALTSDCRVTSQWTADNVNARTRPETGERG